MRPLPRRVSRALFGVTLAALLALVPLLLAADLDEPPAPVPITVDGDPLMVPAGTTLGQAIRSLGLHPVAGRLLDVEDHVLERRVDPGTVLLNGAPRPRRVALRRGDAIEVRDGKDRTEGTRRVVEPLPGVHPANPQFTLGRAETERITVAGRRSGTVVSVSYRAVRKLSQPPAVALTFDDGPWPGSTRAILKILRQMHVKATFFVVGSLVERYPGVVRELVDAGMTIGNHSWDHVESPAFSDLEPGRTEQEMMRTNEALARFGVQTYLFRPPGGSWDADVIRIADEQGMRITQWDVDPRDWSASATPRSITRNVLRNIEPGSIVDLHDGGGGASVTIEALPDIVRGIRKMGLRIVAIPR